MISLFLITCSFSNVYSRVLFPVDVYSVFYQTFVANNLESESVHGGPVPSLGVVRLSQHLCSSYTFVNARGVRLVGTSWINPVSPVGLVYISHGFSEHMEYYDKLGTALAEAGLYAFGHDHQGHGRSGGERVNIADYQFFVDDIFQHVDLWMEELDEQLPVFLFGHSMGGLVVTLACIERQDMFQGAVLTGPLIRSDMTHGEGSHFKRLIAKKASKFAPSLQGGDRLSYTEITSNPLYIQKIKEDPLFWKGYFKARQTHATFQALDRLDMQFEKVVVPLLVLHGSEDTITQPEGSQLLVTEASSTDQEFIEVEGMKHHLILEVDGMEIISKTVTWIISRL